MHKFVLIIGKWSMADVFVVGVFMAFLAGQANPNVQAALHQGFYWFLAYCLISILSSQTLQLNVEDVAK
ncbi:MAG: paraquat-inducible protein A [Thiotrichales bacterium]|nr:paraquat-inducible protein A [Thiotrichales bacterium]